MLSLVDALKSSFLSFPEFWLLLPISFISGVKHLSTGKFNISDFMGMLLLYGLFGYLLIMISFGLWSWDTILSEFKITPSIFFVLRVAALSAGYSLTKKYLYNHAEYGLKQRKRNVSTLMFAEFISICGSIAGYLCLIIMLGIFHSL